MKALKTWKSEGDNIHYYAWCRYDGGIVQLYVERKNNTMTQYITDQGYLNIHEANNDVKSLNRFSV